MLATAVKTIIAAVQKDQEAQGCGCSEGLWIMGVIGIGNARRPKAEEKSGEEKGVLAVCESDGSVADSEAGSNTSSEGDLLGVPEFMRSGADKEQTIWKGKSLI